VIAHLHQSRACITVVPVIRGEAHLVQENTFGAYNKQHIYV
jgi:hypothetical protein